MLVHGGAELLPAMDQELRNRAFVALDEQGIDIHTATEDQIDDAVIDLRGMTLHISESTVVKVEFKQPDV